ncbi:MAG: DNA-binding response regulator, partial [Bacteroidales bacterium]|nr:DNA-binding response regulator [Bacteroidales bacterium]
VDLNDANELLYTHMKNLRRKLASKARQDYIKTIYGIGYKFSAELA